MSITYSQLAKLSLKERRESLRRRRFSRFAWRASASSTSSDMTGSMKPRPCGASGFCWEREMAKSEPWETRRRGVRLVMVGGKSKSRETRVMYTYGSRRRSILLLLAGWMISDGSVSFLGRTAGDTARRWSWRW